MWVIDFEASSLSRNSYPIEVGVTNGTRVYTSFIRPMDHWEDWSLESAEIHHIDRRTLFSDGVDAKAIAHMLNGILAGQNVYCDNAEWDGFWANVLFSDNGIHQNFAIKDIRGLFIGDDDGVESLIRQREKLIQSGNFILHRALDDAQLLWKALNAIQHRIILNIIGPFGRTICNSKTRYSTLHPHNLVVFNATICASDKKLWWGDIDLTVDEGRLIELAELVEQTVYLLPEFHSRLDYEMKPPIDKAIYSCTNSSGRLSSCYENDYHRDNGVLIRTKYNYT